MGLSAAEKEGCRRILTQLDTSDLLSLYQTVMKCQTAVRVKAELIEKIIEASKTADELLKRKKVCRDIIFQYMNNEQIFMLAKSTKQELIQRSMEHWTKSDIPITVESNAAEKSSSYSLQLENKVSDFDLSQLSIKVDGLSIHNNQEDSNQVVKAELPTMLDAKAHPSDTASKPPPNIVHKATSQSRKTPQKSKKEIPQPRENASSKPTCTNQSIDSNTRTMFHISTPGAKPKDKNSSNTTISSTVSFTVTVSEQTTDKSSQVHDTKGPRTKKQ